MTFACSHMSVEQPMGCFLGKGGYIFQNFMEHLDMVMQRFTPYPFDTSPPARAACRPPPPPPPPPQPRGADVSGHCRTSTASARCQIECHTMPDRMSEYASDRNQIECQNIYQIKCQAGCNIECQMECQYIYVRKTAR